MTHLAFGDMVPEQFWGPGVANHSPSHTLILIELVLIQQVAAG
jgi:hypothetical protein